jgi:hypothetical protein
VDVTLLYFDGCANWRTADDNLRAALGEAGLTTAEVHYRRVETVEEAEALRFVGSPTLLIDGIDPFSDPQASVGLSCRLYRTASGLAGVPSIEQIRAALEKVPGTPRIGEAAT